MGIEQAPQSENSEDFQTEVNESRKQEIRNGIQRAIFADHFGFDNLMKPGSSNEEMKKEAADFAGFWTEYEKQHLDVYEGYENDPDRTIKEVEKAFESKFGQAV